MNSQLIRERFSQDTKPFVLRLGDGTRVPVAHPDCVAVSPGQVRVINPKTEGTAAWPRCTPLPSQEASPKKRRAHGKHSR